MDVQEVIVMVAEDATFRLYSFVIMFFFFFFVFFISSLKSIDYIYKLRSAGLESWIHLSFSFRFVFYHIFWMLELTSGV